MQKIRYFFPFVFLGLMFVILVAPPAKAQLQDALEELSGEYARGYMAPAVDAFANNLNAGIYRTAHVSRLGIHLYVGLVSMATLISDQDKVFLATPPPGFGDQPVETATVFGGTGTVLESPSGMTYQFQNGQIQGDVLPFAVPQLEVGSILGTMVKVRMFSGKFLGSQGEGLGDIELKGFGIQHSISQYIPLFPIDVSVGYFRQTFDVGDVLSTKATSIGVQASKSFALLTIYGGMAFEKTTLDVHYTYTGGTEPEEISLSFESKNKQRITAGARLKLGFLILNGDYSMGQQQSFSLGIGLGI